MTLDDNAYHEQRETRGLLLGFVGVLCFSVSLPATRVAVRELEAGVEGVIDTLRARFDMDQGPIGGTLGQNTDVRLR